MEQMLKELLEMVRNMTEQLSAMQEIIATKDAQIVALTAKIEELTHKKNSSNSSTPPSTERLEKPKPKSLRTKSGRKPGRQTGHKGSGMKIDRKPDKTVPHHPVQCQGCPYAGQCQYKVSGTRYEYEVIVKTELIAHQVLSCMSCKMTGGRVEGKFPAHINGAKQYGAGVSALTAALLTVGYMSVDRVQKLLNSLGIHISQGAIQGMLGKAASRVEATVEQIKQKIGGLKVAHFDETGVRVDGKLHWLHCACNDEYRLYSVQEKRGSEAMDATGILPNFRDIAVTDFWRPCQKYDNVLYAMCCQHLERELVYAEETGNQEWAKLLRELLQTMCHRRKELQSQGCEAFPEAELAEYLNRYDTLVQQGIEANPISERKPGKRGRPARGKIRCLLDRFSHFKEEIPRFARDSRVSFVK